MASNDRPLLPTNDVLTVSALNRLARSLLEDCFPAVTVEGEISNLSTPGSGHWYLTLKDDNAQIRCAMFRNRNMRVRLRPVNGMQVVVRGKLSLYEARGDYQLILDSMEDAGAGALQKAYEQLKAKLKSEGLFEAERKKPIPTHCQHIGVITSPAGAVIRDILTVLKRRFPAMQVTLFPVVVQGNEACQAIIKALQTANMRAPELGLDALIVGRGGGSLEDMQAFNDESVARSIAESHLPVVSAVGHETDFTIADFVADVRAATPSAAAELLSPDQAVYMHGLEQLLQRLQRNWQQQRDQARQHLHHLGQRLRHPGRRLQEQTQTVDGLEMRLRRAMQGRQKQSLHHLQQLRSRLLMRSPRVLLRQQIQNNRVLTQRLQRAVQHFLATRMSTLNQLSRSLNAVSPLQTLGRGYSITSTDQGTILRQATDVHPGTVIHTQLANGTLASVVSDTQEPVNTKHRTRLS